MYFMSKSEMNFVIHKLACLMKKAIFYINGWLLFSYYANNKTVIACKWYIDIIDILSIYS